MIIKQQFILLLHNQAAIHIEVHYHITWEKGEDGVIATPYVSTRVQIADMFTKALCKTRLGLLCNKLGSYDIYSPT